MIVRGSETVLVQGITGKQGTFWSERMRDYGTKIIGGVNPKRAGETHLGLPVWATARDAARETNIDAAVMFIPPFGVKEAALDAIDAGIGKIVCLTEHVPVHDTMYVLAAARERGAQVIGPNTAGIVTVGECFVGFMPAFNPRVFQPGSVGVISRSGSLGTLLCLNLVQAGPRHLGLRRHRRRSRSSAPPPGMRSSRSTMMPKTKAIALVGEIGGAMEEEAAEYARTMQEADRRLHRRRRLSARQAHGACGRHRHGRQGQLRRQEGCARSGRRHRLRDAQRRRREPQARQQLNNFRSAH